MRLTPKQVAAIDRMRQSQEAFGDGWRAGRYGYRMDEGKAHVSQYVNGYRAGRQERIGA